MFMYASEEDVFVFRENLNERVSVYFRIGIRKAIRTVAGQVSDAILVTILAQDPKARVAAGL